jgi:hypothetical protein
MMLTPAGAFMARSTCISFPWKRNNGELAKEGPWQVVVVVAAAAGGEAQSKEKGRNERGCGGLTSHL